MKEQQPSNFEERRQRAKQLFNLQPSIYNPYFKSHVRLSADGFHHLQFSARRERSKSAQLLKFNLLPLALDVIRCAGTLQEFRQGYFEVSKRSGHGEMSLMHTTYFAFVAIIGGRNLRIRVILRKVGNGAVHFWSVMPDTKIKDGRQKLHAEGIEDE